MILFKHVVRTEGFVISSALHSSSQQGTETWCTNRMKSCMRPSQYPKISRCTAINKSVLVVKAAFSLHARKLKLYNQHQAARNSYHTDMTTPGIYFWMPGATFCFLLEQLNKRTYRYAMTTAPWQAHVTNKITHVLFKEKLSIMKRSEPGQNRKVELK